MKSLKTIFAVLLLFSSFSLIGFSQSYYEQGFNNISGDNGRPPCWKEGYGTFSNIYDGEPNLMVTPFEGDGVFISGGSPLEGYAAVRTPFFEAEATDSFSFYYNVNSGPNTLRMAVYVQPYDVNVTAADLDYGLPAPINNDTISFTYNASGWYNFKDVIGITDTVRLVVKFFDIPSNQDQRALVDYIKANSNINGDINRPEINISQTECFGTTKKFAADVYRGDGSQDTSFPLEVLWYLNSSLVQKDTLIEFSYGSFNTGDTLKAAFYAFSPCATDGTSDSLLWFSQTILVEDCRSLTIEDVKPQSLCRGNNFDVTFSRLGDFTGETFTLERSDVNSKTFSGNTLGTSVNPDTTISVSTDLSWAEGKYYLRVKDSKGTTSLLDSVIIYAEPSSSLTITLDPVCSGDSASLTISSSVANLSYILSYQGNVDSIQAPIYGTGSDISFNLFSTTDTTYQIKIVDTITGCYSFSSAKLFINELPISNGSLITNLVNTDTFLINTVSNGQTPYSFSWSDTAFIIDADENIQMPRTEILTASRTFTLTVTDANGCTDTAIVDVSIYGGPLFINAEVVNGDSVTCSGDSVTLRSNASGGSGVYTYAWKSIVPDYGFTSNAKEPKVAPADTTLFEIEVFDGFNYIRDSVMVYAKALPNISVTSDPVVCADKDIDLSASGGVNYAWSTGDGTANITVIPSDTTVYYVTVTNAQNCLDIDSVTVYTKPSPKVSLPANFTLGYFHDTVIVASITEAGTSGTTVVWSPADSIVSTNYDSAFTEQLVASTWFNIKVTDNGNSCFWEDSVLVSISSSNFNTFIYTTTLVDKDTSICEESSVVLNAYSEGGSGTYTYEWRDIANSLISTDDSITFTPPSETKVYLYSNDGVETVMDSITIGVNPLPQITFMPGDGEYVMGKEIEFTASGAQTYLWDYNKYITTGLLAESVIVKPDSNTVLYVLGTDINSCSTRDSVSLTVSTFNWYVPEAFSPNNDGSNDYLYVYGNGIKSIYFRIYNKWGQMVFETREWNGSENKSGPWDGMFNGNKQHNQTLGWVLEITDLSGNIYEEQGIVTIIR